MVKKLDCDCGCVIKLQNFIVLNHTEKVLKGFNQGILNRIYTLY